MHVLIKENETNRIRQYVDYGKASPEARLRVLDALDHELSEALQEKRRPLLDKVFERLGSFPRTLM